MSSETSQVMMYCAALRECKPEGIFQTRVYVFGGLQIQTWVPGFDIGL